MSAPITHTRLLDLLGLTVEATESDVRQVLAERSHALNEARKKVVRLRRERNEAHAARVNVAWENAGLISLVQSSLGVSFDAVRATVESRLREYKAATKSRAALAETLAFLVTEATDEELATAGLRRTT